jgi:hypothetical protein
MTTQAIAAVVGSGSLAREFTDTSTDDTWNGNILTDAVAGTNLGLVMPGRMIDHVQVTYEAGACIWRIQSAQTLVVKRWGYAVKAAHADWAGAAIPAYTVAADDILVAYPIAAAPAGQTDCVAWVMTNRGHESFGANGIVDDTATELKTLVNTQTLGDYAFNAVLNGVTIQAEDGATVKEVQVIDQTGGQVWVGYGGKRLPTAGASNAYWNFKADGLSVPILKGYTLKVVTVSGA